MKTCIWCSKSEPYVTFKKEAHTIPQSLGGREIAPNVCDACNQYFGSYQKGVPPIEVVLKEAFSLTRARLLATQNEIGKNKAMPRFTSEFFNFHQATHSISAKPKYKLRRHFQSDLAIQLKRALYKVYLEERDRQFHDAHLNKYNFIRQFARYGLNDLPVFYYWRRLPIIALSTDHIKHPEFFFDAGYRSKYLVDEAGFFEFEIFGHTFGIATTAAYEPFLDNYLDHSMKAKADTFKECRALESFSDVDLVMSFISRKL